MRLDFDAADFADPAKIAAMGAKALASQQLPDVEQVGPRPGGEAGDRRAPTAPARSSPTPASCPTSAALQGTDSHLYFGWYFGNERDFPAFAKAVPSQVRFPTEFGAQAVPDTDDFIDAEAGPTSTGTASPTHPRPPAVDARQVRPP